MALFREGGQNVQDFRGRLNLSSSADILIFPGNHPLPENQGEGLSTHVFLSNADDPGFVMLRFLDVAGLNVFAEPFPNTYFPKFLFSHLASLK